LLKEGVVLGSGLQKPKKNITLNPPEDWRSTAFEEKRLRL
jgi:hypothetical protein